MVASLTLWRAIFHSLTNDIAFSPPFRTPPIPDDLSQPILTKEAFVLRNTLVAARHLLRGSRLDGHVDSLPLAHACNNQGSKSNALSDIIKAVYETAQKFNVNEANVPSRALSQYDCMLAILVWKQLEARWDPQSVDLMSLDSNVERGADGQPLTHFTPWTTKNYSGVNVFAQSLDPRPTCTSSPPPPPPPPPPLILVGPWAWETLTMILHFSKLHDKCKIFTHYWHFNRIEKNIKKSILVFIRSKLVSFINPLPPLFFHFYKGYPADFAPCSGVPPLLLTEVLATARQETIIFTKQLSFWEV